MIDSTNIKRRLTPKELQLYVHWAVAELTTERSVAEITAFITAIQRAAYERGWNDSVATPTRVIEGTVVTDA